MSKIAQSSSTLCVVQKAVCARGKGEGTERMSETSANRTAKRRELGDWWMHALWHAVGVGDVVHSECEAQRRHISTQPPAVVEAEHAS